MSRVIVFLFLIFSCNENPKTTLQGIAFGTSYSVQYFSEDQVDYSIQLDSIFDLINNSMSTYIDTSIISRINNNEPVKVDNHFVNVFNTSKKIFDKTKGKFDPSVGILVNFWGFGPKFTNIPIDSLDIDNLKILVGFEKFNIDDTNIVLRPKNSFLDFNAIAKGYTVDLISGFLDDNNINNYLVEIGGELRAKGSNLSKKNSWIIGIDEPRFDDSQNIFITTELNNVAMATSGVYRKYKIDSNGRRYAHILDPLSGIPARTNILSVSVISETCIEADAYATALHLMNINQIEDFLIYNKDVSVYVIYENESREMIGKAYNDF